MILLSAAVLFLDQLTKRLATIYLSGRGPIKLIDGLLDLTYVRNKGAAFGLLAEASARVRIPFFLAITLVAFYLLWRFFRRIPEGVVLLTVAISLIFSGALGNLIDRTRQGEVVDFIDLYVGSYHWPAFNLADLSITTGAFLLVLYFIKARE